MKINKIAPNYNISFRAYSEKTYADNELNHYTHFFRNEPTLKFTRDYITENFPKGTNIAEWGCSDGEKPYSLLIALDKNNEDKKYKIVGYDFEKPIEQAKQGIYKVSKFGPEREIIDEPNSPLSKGFFKYFHKIKEDANNFYVKPDKELTSGLIDFKVGNILDISKTLKPKENGVIIFQTALYHLIRDSKNQLNDVKKLFQDISKLLPDKGIFVLGSFPLDHMYEPDCEDLTNLTYQKNQRIRIFNSSRIHEFLKSEGFEPIFYEVMPKGSIFSKYNDVHLPSVWKKINRL